MAANYTIRHSAVIGLSSDHDVLAIDGGAVDCAERQC